jgi:hypothetical protein
MAYTGGNLRGSCPSPALAKSRLGNAGGKLRGIPGGDVLSLLSVCLGLSRPPDGLSALNIALPPPWTSTYEFIGLTHFTADELNRINLGSKYPRQLTYVTADVPSTSPDVVSVNPIDDYTWGAAVLSLRGDCLLILNTHKPENPKHGDAFYGWYPRGAPCLGSAATQETVRQTIWEMHESRTGQRP